MIEVTVPAIAKMKEVCESNAKPYIRFGVKGGGCAGFKYKWGFIDNKEDVGADDHTEDWHTGKFVVDDASMLYVAGTKIDWKEEVFGSQFEISNPNASSGCGCGESFGV